MGNKPSLSINDTIPNFKADTQDGEISLHEYFSDSWGILFSHPADFTPVCATELGIVAGLAEEFAKRNVKPVALSCDTVESHKGWIPDIKVVSGNDVNYPIIADPSRKIASGLGMLDPKDLDKAGLPLTVRKVFIVAPDKTIKLIITYPASTGRNFDEIIRCIDSLQLTATKSMATPGNWKQGDETMLLPSVSEEVAAEKYPNHRVLELPSGKPYVRYVPSE